MQINVFTIDHVIASDFSDKTVGTKFGLSLNNG